ncbi:MAG: hypothetical protein ACRENH_17070 [Gemmatimonadaceae bacterium]
MRRTVVSLALLGTINLPALAHEKGSIRLASKQVPVGGELALRGTRLPKNSTLQLQLRGTLETFPLGEIRVDAAGATQARIALPAEARMGAYKVTVVAPDGDVAAQADLIIVAAAAVPMDAMTAEEHAKMVNTSPTATAEPHATAEQMDLDVKATPVEWAVIAAVVVACAAAGVVLLTGGSRAT